MSPAARSIRGRDPEWWVPPLWRSEFLNVLVRCARSEVIDEKQAATCWALAAELFISREIQPSESGILEIALEREISAYDAHYVALAVTLGIPLVTGDKKLVRKCRDVAVSVGDFAAQS